MQRANYKVVGVISALAVDLPVLGKLFTIFHHIKVVPAYNNRSDRMQYSLLPDGLINF